MVMSYFKKSVTSNGNLLLFLLGNEQCNYLLLLKRNFPSPANMKYYNFCVLMHFVFELYFL